MKTKLLIVSILMLSIVLLKAQNNKCSPFNNTTTIEKYILNDASNQGVIKSIIGHRISSNKNFKEKQDSAIICLFDKNSNLIEYSEPHYYISETYRYDSFRKNYI